MIHGGGNTGREKCIDRLPGPIEQGVELGRFCADRLADYKVPESFTLGASPLPRNANGKVMKRVLREQVPPAAPVTRRA